MTGQYFYGDSVVHRWGARGKFYGFLCMTAATVLARTAAGYALLVLVTAGLLWLSRLPWDVTLGAVRRMTWFFVVIFLLNTLFYSSDEPIAQWWIFQLSAEGMLQGANIVARVVIILILSNLLTATTRPLELMAGIESLLRPLRLFRVPVEQVAMILSVALQFIPTLQEQADTIRKAQTARGARFESRHILDRAKSMGALVTPVFLSAFQRADELSLAMEARGYRDAKQRTKKRREPLTWQEWGLVLAGAAVCGLELILR